MNPDQFPKPPKFIQIFCTVFFSVCGLTLLFCAVFTPPIGEIHPTVLAAFGMILTFVGTTIGIDYNYKSKAYNTFQEFMKFNRSCKAPKSQSK